MSDVFHLWRKGIPSVYFGPGTLDQCHVVDERIALEDIVRAANLYTRIAADALGVPKERRDALSAAIDPAAVVALAADMVRIPSENPPGNERDMIAFVASWLEARGIGTNVVEGAPGRLNLVAKMHGINEGPVLLFNGHVDVVPAGDGWSMAPFAGIIQNGQLFGRGACDMKGGLAAMLTVADAFWRSQAPFSGTLAFAVVSDEETGGNHGTGALIDSGHIQADMAIVAEPSDFALSVSEGTMLWLKLTSRGRGTHTVNSDGTGNALENLARFIVSLGELRDELERRYPDDPPKLTTNVVTGGTKVNIVPGACEAMVDFRFAPHLDLDEARALTLVDSRLENLRRTRPDFDVSYTYEAKSGFLQPEDTLIVRLVENAVRSVLGRDPEWWHRYGITSSASRPQQDAP